MSNNIKMVSDGKAVVHGCTLELSDWKIVIASKRSCEKLINSLKEFKESGNYCSVAVLDHFSENSNNEFSYHLALAYIENDRDACNVEAFPVYARAVVEQGQVSEVIITKDDCQITECGHSRETIEAGVKDFVLKDLEKQRKLEEQNNLITENKEQR